MSSFLSKASTIEPLTFKSCPNSRIHHYGEQFQIDRFNYGTPEDFITQCRPIVKAATRDFVINGKENLNRLEVTQGYSKESLNVVRD